MQQHGPGLRKEDIKIEIEGNNLLISGERRSERKPEASDKNIRHERLYGKFERTFVLQPSVSADKIEAHYENGVLNVALPKTEETKGRSVPVQTGAGSFFEKLIGSKKETRVS